MRLVSLLAFGLALLALLGAPSVGATSITFEEVPVGTKPGPDKYAQAGVVFPASAQVVSLPGKAHSGSNVLVSADPATEFHTPPLALEFRSDVSSVSLFTGVPWDTAGRPAAITLDAYDAAGRVVDHAAASAVGPTGLSVRMAVKAPAGKAIRRVLLNVANHFEYIDDITFEPVGAGPHEVLAPPTVSIVSPALGALTLDGKATLSGIIEGEGLYPRFNPPQLTISYATDPAFQEPSSVTTYLFPPALLGAAPRFSFSLPLQLTHLGVNHITVAMTNAAGTGRAQVPVTYLPQDMVQVFDARGGAAAFGQFLWGGGEGGCQVAVYQNGGIFKSRAGVFPSLGSIFAKWSSLRSATRKLGLGCALGDVQADSASTYSAQNFEGGRIYNSRLGAHQLTEPFLAALDAIDFVGKYGPPASDPVQQGDANLPRWWQQFAKRYGDIERAASVEITDARPTMWIAVPDVEGAGAVGATVSERTATLWRGWPCASVNGPCPPRAEVTPPYLAESAGSVACHGERFGWTEWTAEGLGLGQSIIDQWMPMPGHDGKITTLEGTVLKSTLSDEDNPIDHACSVGLSRAGVDWNTYVAPDRAFRNRIYSSLQTMQIEYEWCLAGVPTPVDPADPGQKAKDAPQQGDKIYLAGRFIADCAHGFPPEIHPPAVMINLYSVGKANAARVLGNLVYFPWWYQGQAASFELGPPPRPSPRAPPGGELPDRGDARPAGNARS